MYIRDGCIIVKQIHNIQYDNMYITCNSMYRHVIYIYSLYIYLYLRLIIVYIDA